MLTVLLDGPVLRGKYTYIDAAVLLGVIHGYAGDNIYSFSDERILVTAWQIATSFTPVYPIAATHKDSQGRTLGIPVGRYPEDTYNVRWPRKTVHRHLLTLDRALEQMVLETPGICAPLQWLRSCIAPRASFKLLVKSKLPTSVCRSGTTSRPSPRSPPDQPTRKGLAR